MRKPTQVYEYSWSVVNVVCYENVCYEQVCFDRKLDPYYRGPRFVVCSEQTRIQGGDWGDRPATLNLTKVNIFTMILQNSQSSIRDSRSFWRPTVLSQIDR